MPTEIQRTAKLTFAGYGIILFFAIIMLRLWQLQILQGSEYRKESELNRLRVIGVPAPRGIIFDRNGVPLVKNTPFFCASVVPAEFQSSNLPQFAKVLKIPEAALLSKIQRKGQSPFVPVRLKEGLSFDEVSFIEARHSDLPGLIIDIDVNREYIYGSTGAHVLGYLGKVNPEQLQTPEFKNVPPDAFVGQWGVEKVFDKSLRGVAGQRVIEVDALGKEIRLLREVPPVKGEDILLSLDIALQQEAEKAFAGRPGALVAIAPDTGEVLGFISSPSFDPNQFTRGISADEWLTLSMDKKLPMLNRAIQSQYPPGSTFKIIMALAALEEGAASDVTTVDCRGGISYGKWHFGCWRKTGHNSVSMHRAIVESCDVYFYEVGKRLGIDKIYEYASRFGLGKETGIQLGGEKKGLIPNSAWKQATKKAPWFLGETFVNSIGQGYVLATPLQMAVMMGAVANGGNVYQPALIKGAPPVLRSSASISEDIIQTVRRYLGGVVNEAGGTGWTARSAMTTIGGKTGTAQVVGMRKDSKFLPEKFRDHAWFVAFAPTERPEIALSVLVEHGGHGGSVAAPIAKKAIEAFLLADDKKKEILHVQN